MKLETAKKKQKQCPRHGDNGHWLEACRTPAACRQAQKTPNKPDDNDSRLDGERCEDFR